MKEFSTHAFTFEISLPMTEEILDILMKIFLTQQITPSVCMLVNQHDEGPHSLLQHMYKAVKKAVPA